MTEKYFPQVGDNELMLTEMPHMNLYDETDLISNITGDYVDKNYLEWQPIAENTKPKHPYHQPLEEPLPKRRPVRKPDFKEPIDKKRGCRSTRKNLDNRDAFSRLIKYH